MLNASALPAPRFTTSSAVVLPTTETSTSVARKSSLLIGRTRRAVTEEPEEGLSGRRSSMLLRTRRAGTEEPEDGRKTSLLRDRRGTTEEEDEESRVRAPSRAGTELASPRAVSHNYASLNAASYDASPNLNSSALPRRRIGSSMLNSTRLMTPASPSTAATPTTATRRYFERSTPDREGSHHVIDKIAEDRGPRHFSLAQGSSLLSRTTSLLRRPNRDSNTTNTSTTAQTGSYR